MTEIQLYLPTPQKTFLITGCLFIRSLFVFPAKVACTPSLHACWLGWLDGCSGPSSCRALPCLGKKKAVSPQDTPSVNDGAEGGAGVGGEKMAERGSSSRKRGRGVKWRQVFHDKPYPPLFFSPVHSNNRDPLRVQKTNPRTDTC